MRQATAELNEEYYARIGQIEQANPHDILEIEASDGVSAIRWEDVLSVYAVKVTTDGVNGMDVVTMDEQKKEILRGVMWDMNQITYRSVTVKKEVEVVTEDEDGNEVVEMQEIEETTLTIYLHHTTPEQMAAAYGFTEQQNEHLALLRHEEYSVMWASLLGGFTHGGGMIGSDARLGRHGHFCMAAAAELYHHLTVWIPHRPVYGRNILPQRDGYCRAVWYAGSCGSGRHGDSCKRDRPVGRKLWILRKDTA